MTETDFRGLAQHHLSKAKHLLSRDEEGDVSYACLELRKTIEALAYDLLQRYLPEVSATAIRVWQPKKVLDELAYVDPEISGDINLSIEVPATETAPARTIHLGNEYRLKGRWANKVYNTLGNFLHMPTIEQLKSGTCDERIRKERAAAEEILAELEKILSSTLSGFKVDRLVKFSCQCGALVARDVEFLEAGKDVICAGCGRHYTYRLDPQLAGYHFTLRKVDWSCTGCNASNEIACHDIVEGRLIECATCKARHVIQRRFIALLAAEMAPTARPLLGT